MTRISRLIVANALAALFSLSHVVASEAQTTLADKPIFGAPDVPGNLALSLSVEFPTAISVANIGNYDDTMSYLGYFDPAKCYVYNAINTGTVMAPNYGTSYFQPYAMATGTNSHQCAGYWSGNFMNWAAMQTIDPFRWALTGGYRRTDSVTQTILEKAWGPSTEGSASENFNYRGTGQYDDARIDTYAIHQLVDVQFRYLGQRQCHGLLAGHRLHERGGSGNRSDQRIHRQCTTQ
jgi:type IV pilus assembly protein PilY1